MSPFALTLQPGTLVIKNSQRSDRILYNRTPLTSITSTTSDTQLPKSTSKSCTSSGNLSWYDDTVIRDAKSGIYTDPTRFREINHIGKYFNVPGPHICQPSLERTPVLMQASTSSSGKRFATKNAEAISVAGHSPSVVAKSIKEIRALAKGFRRQEPSLKFLAMICPVLAKMEEEAKAKYEDYLSYASTEGAFTLFGSWTGIDLAQYGDDEEFRHVESNAIR